MVYASLKTVCVEQYYVFTADSLGKSITVTVFSIIYRLHSIGDF